MKVYIKEHKNKKAVDTHIEKIKKRSGVYILNGSTIKYSFDKKATIQGLKSYQSKENKGLDKYDVPFNKWTDISDDVVGVMFVYSTKNWAVIYGDHWDNDGFMVRTDKDTYYLESSGGKVEKPFKTLTEAKRFAYNIVKEKLR